MSKVYNESNLWFEIFGKLSKLQAGSSRHIICKLKQDLIFSGICQNDKKLTSS